MSKITVDTRELTLAVGELTEELELIIGQEVHKLHTKILQKGRDVYDTGHFFRSIRSPVKRGNNWRIALRADYSSILWSGRNNDLKIGSKKWYYGGNPMLKNMEHEIIKRADDVIV